MIPWQLPRYTKAMDLAANNRWLAVAKGLSDQGGSVSILDICTGRELHTFKGHLGSVNQIGAAPFGQVATRKPMPVGRICPQYRRDFRRNAAHGANQFPFDWVQSR